MTYKLPTLLLSALLLTACSSAPTDTSNMAQESQTTQETETNKESTASKDTETTTEKTETTADTGDLFTDRDLNQTPDLSQAAKLELFDNQQSVITDEGTYLVSGSYKNSTIVVEAADDAKVQLVLDGVDIENETTPAVYVKNADKVFVTTTSTNNTLKTTGTFTADGDTNTDAVIFSRDDIILNGTGTLNIQSSDNGVTSKDDIKITGGILNIASSNDGLEANERILINDGEININSYKDCMHAEYDEDDSVGSVMIFGGVFNLQADDDGIQATTTLQIDGGIFTINAAEGLESTELIINGGTIDITATDDGINAAAKTSKMRPSITINNGDLTVVMGPGDTDAIDSNGDLTINGGNLNIQAQSPFDYDGTGKLNGGTIIVNGQQVNQLTNQMMGGGGRGMRG